MNNVLSTLPPYFSISSYLPLFLTIFISSLSLSLLELRRYYKAAEEAAQEVLLEQGQLSVRNGPNSGFNSAPKQGNGLSSSSSSSGDIEAKDEKDKEKEPLLWSGDVLRLTQVGMKPINSPSRLVALQLANGNALFRLVWNCVLV